MTSVAAGPSLVQVEGVSKRYGATLALDDVSVAIEAGRSHALVGRNGAGKSTLVKILTGLEGPDSGTVRFGGVEAPALTRRRDWAARVACVHQRSMIVPDLSVVENLMLDAIAQGGATVSWKRLREESRDLLELWRLDVSPDTRARELSVGERQLLEIARSLHGGSRFIIMDEPTSQLQAKEIEALFGHIERLKAEGVTFLYISHHLAELYEICDHATVLRDGRHVTTQSVATLDRDRMVEAMVGTAGASAHRRAQTATADATTDPGAGSGSGAAAVLDVVDLSGEHFTGVSLSVRRGERVGVAGISGCGKVDLAASIAGLKRPRSGHFHVQGKQPPFGDVAGAVEAGIGYVPEDRHRNGFCANLSIEENLTSTVTRRLSRGGLLSRRRRAELARRLFDDLQIRASSPAQLAGELSGGNQQKVVLGRALASDPDVLVLVTPTAGIDIASKDVIFEHVRNLECGVVVVSDDLEELALCDRVLVMFEGAIRAEMAAERTDDRLVAAMEGVGL